MENETKNNLNVTVGVEDIEKSKFLERLEVLKNKVYEWKNLNYKSEREVNSLAKQFILEFKDDRAELGKIISWLEFNISPEELVSIVGQSTNDEDLGRLSVILKARLYHNYKEPVSFMNDHVSKLVEVLNTYDNYIENFESIEVSDDLNCLDKNKYLISHDLHNLLLNGYKLTRDRYIDKKARGVYMVVFKKLRIKGEDVLMYNYIKYPYVFQETIYNYVVKESSSLVITNDQSVGVDYIFVMENMFNKKEDLVFEINRLSDQFKHKTLYNNSRGIYPRNIVDLCKMLLQGCPVFLHKVDICKLMDMILHKKYYEAIVGFIELYAFYKDEEGGMTMLEERLKKPNLDKYNLLGRLVFITEDLDGLIKDVRKNSNLSVNEGPQSWRGQSNSLSHTINSIDCDFRKSLNRHNQYHVNVGNIPRNSLIGRSKFSYQNIHLNIGNVRWYSSKTFIKPVLNNNVSIFNEIGDFIKNSPINNDTQLKIETALNDHSYINLTEKRNSKEETPVINYSLINRKFTSLLIEERSKLVDYISRTRDMEFKEEPTTTNDLIQYLLSTVLKELNNDYIISVIYGRLFKIVNNHFVNQENNKGIDIFIDIGNDLVSNYFYTLYIKRKADFGDKYFKLSDWKEENELMVSKFDSSMKAEMGGKVIGFLKNMDLIQFKVVVKGLKEKNTIVVPTKRILEVVDNNSIIKPLPKRLPMIVKPLKYFRMAGGREILGGYLLNNEKYMDPLIITKWNFKKPTLIKNENLVYDLVNNINSVGFKVNKDVLDFINIYGSRYNLLISPTYEHPLSKKNKLTKLEFVELSSFLSKKDLQDNILSVAEIYSNVHEFFLPTRLDFRGRLYCISEFLNYQSTELAKSLLLFSNSEKLYKFDKTGIEYLKAYGANCFGNKLDKMSWKARSKWVDDNLDKIISFRDGDLIEKADNKLLFISFCFEYNRFLESLDNDKEYFETGLPIQLDATCNGYQHLALLSLDHDLAKELNLTKSTPNDAPKDFYNFIGIKLVNYFRDELNNNKNLSDEERDVYNRFSNIVVARKMIKKVIMTKVYNVTYFKMIDYLKENFEVIDTSDKTNLKYCFKDDTSLILMEKDFSILVKGLIVVMVEDNSKLEKLLKYLQKVVDITNTLNLPLNWGTPETGVDIEQSYVKSKKERLKVFSYIKKTFNISIADTNEYNKRKQKTSFLPNFIHSLDAASLALLVHYYFTDGSLIERNIYTIHDCFAVTANNVKNLQLYLSSVYQKIYTEKSYLMEFHKNTISNIEYICKKDTHYEGNTFMIKIKGGKKPKFLKFPSVETVLGSNCNKDDFVKDSSYLTN